MYLYDQSEETDRGDNGLKILQLHRKSNYCLSYTHKKYIFDEPYRFLTCIRTFKCDSYMITNRVITNSS